MQCAAAPNTSSVGGRSTLHGQAPKWLAAAMAGPALKIASQAGRWLAGVSDPCANNACPKHHACVENGECMGMHNCVVY